jgi:hypothetical protein
LFCEVHDKNKTYRKSGFALALQDLPKGITEGNPPEYSGFIKALYFPTRGS